MAITIDWGTRVISIPLSYLALLDSDVPLYQLDVDQFRLHLKGLEETEDGMTEPDTHTHNTEVTLSGEVYARSVEIVNGYTVTFEDGQYAVKCVNANHNIADVKNLNQVSLIIGNSAGLIRIELPGSGLSAEEKVSLANAETSSAAAATSSASADTAATLGLTESELARKILENRQEMIESGGFWWLVIFDDDGTTELFRNKLRDKNGGAVVVADGAPALRGASQ